MKTLRLAHRVRDFSANEAALRARFFRRIERQISQKSLFS
jgi:hypothetical protein